MMAGFIHFDCLCGLDVYYFGDLETGEPPFEAIESFRHKLAGHRFAIFTSQDEEIVECPCCDSLIQLPGPKIAAYIGRMSLASASTMPGQPIPIHQQSENRLPISFTDGYRPQLSELN